MSTFYVVIVYFLFTKACYDFDILVFVYRDCQVCQAHKVLPVPPDLLAPRLQGLVVSGLLAHPDKTGLQVNQ